MKSITLPVEQRIILKVVLSKEIRSSMTSISLGIEPVFSVGELKALYKKIAGYEWEKEQK